MNRTGCSFTSVLVCLVLTWAAASGCAPANRSIHRWGIYETLIYEASVKPGTADPISAAQRLQADIERTQAGGQSVPPGVHAHLGYLYYNQGDLGAARVEFLTERELYPEATVFVDGILARMRSAVSREEGARVTGIEGGDLALPPSQGQTQTSAVGVGP